MKTTKLLIGALAVMSFAACQNEEMVAEQPSLAQGRKQIDVKIIPTEGVDSRMLNNNGVFSWENTDELGAAMVDPIAEGTLVNDKHFGNALFNYNNGEFTTASTLSVGAYVFYYPYNEENTTSRGGVIVKELGAQKFDATGLEMMNNNFMVAPIAQLAGAEAGELTLPMTFRSIYGYGRFTLTNNSKDEFLEPQTLEIQKIVIENDGDEFVIGGFLAPQTIKANAATENLYVNLKPSNADASALFAKADSVYLDWDRDDDGTDEKAEPIQWISAIGAEKGAVSIDCLTGVKGIEVKPGESITTRVLIPAGSYDKNDITITVYTNLGFVTLTDEEITSSDEEGEFVVRNGRTKTISAVITENPTELTGIISIVGKNDFIATMRQFTQAVGENVKVTLVGDKTVDADMLAAIPAKIADLTFVGDATIEANTTLKNVKFDDGKVTIKGNVTVANEATFVSDSEVIVASGSLTIGKNVTAKSIAVKEGATLNINAGVTLSAEIKEFAGTLNVGGAASRAANEPDPVVINGKILLTAGTVNVNAALTLNDDEHAIFGNYPAIEDAAALTLNVNKNITTSAGKYIYSYSNVTINNNAVLSVQQNQGTIVNNKTLNVTQFNTGTIENAAAATVNVMTNSAKGIINNYGTANVTTNNGTADDAATINQKAETSVLVVTTNSTYGKVATFAGSTTTVTTNDGGEVVYTADALVAINGGEGNVAFEATSLTAAEITALKDIVNKIVITEDYTMAADAATPTTYTIPSNIKTIVFKGDATFNRPIADATAATAATAFEFYGDVNFAKGATFKKGATMTFDGGNTLKGTGITTGTDYVAAAGSNPAVNPTNVTLAWTINNGYMKNYCPVNASDDNWTVTFGTVNEEEGILAGSVWNDPTTCKAKTFTATPAASWKGQTVAHGATTVPSAI